MIISIKNPSSEFYKQTRGPGMFLGLPCVALQIQSQTYKIQSQTAIGRETTKTRFVLYSGRMMKLKITALKKPSQILSVRDKLTRVIATAGKSTIYPGLEV